jgi:hypothetical protein
MNKHCVLITDIRREMSIVNKIRIYELRIIYKIKTSYTNYSTIKNVYKISKEIIGII